MLRRTAVAIGFTLMVTACASPNTEGSTLNLKDWAEQHGFELRKDIAQGPGGFKGKPNPLPMSASAIAGVEVEIGTDSVCDGILYVTGDDASIYLDVYGRGSVPDSRPRLAESLKDPEHDDVLARLSKDCPPI